MRTYVKRKRIKCQSVDVERLKELCSDYDTARVGYGYSSFCKKFDIDISGLKNVLYSNSDFCAGTYYRIAKESGVSLDWLFGLSDKKFRGDDEK